MKEQGASGGWNMSELVQEAYRLLTAMYDEKRGGFSFSTRLEKGTYLNTFDHPLVRRYTVNSLLGLLRLEQAEPGSVDISGFLERFRRNDTKNSERRNPGDEGLLLALLTDAETDDAEPHYQAVRGLVQKGNLPSLPLQEICWILFGLTRHAARSGRDEVRHAAEDVFTHLRNSYLHTGTGFPLHSPDSPRRRYVAFGGITYFLWSLQEYFHTFDDDASGEMFRTLLAKIIAVQGNRGEWPWFFDAATGRVVDRYQVYSVHQDAMSMLFLLPAMDDGISGTAEAVEKSLRWLQGDNELGTPMITTEPFFIYRSIRRKGGLERERRYLRALRNSLGFNTGGITSPSHLEINRECRSYHIGWILYAWSGREWNFG